MATERRYKICSCCGNFSRIEEEQEYCVLCGTKLSDSCRECGSAITLPHAKYCYHCGTPLLKESNKATAKVTVKNLLFNKANSHT